MSTQRPIRSMSIRKWLGIGLATFHVIPALTLILIVLVVFSDTGGPRDVDDDVAGYLADNLDRWADPAWQATFREEFAADEADIVLLQNGAEIFRSSRDPLALGGEGSLNTRQITFPDVDPPRAAIVYTAGIDGPPEELRHWFVPAGLFAALILTVGAMMWFLNRSIVSPLTATSDAAHRVARGELDIALPSSRVREVAELNHAFESMSEELRASLDRQASMEQDRRFLISAIAHDLRTPLFSLRGALEGIDQGIANTPEKRARYLAVAMNKADALERLISDLFAFTRVEYIEEEPDRTAFDLPNFLHQVVDGVRPHAQAQGIALTLRGSSAAGDIEADRHMLSRVMENLLDNALRYTPEGGTVDVGWQVSDATAEIVVTDTGPGIAEQDAAHLFDPLFRGESSRNRKTGGAGLGLTIARRIMQAHGGDLVARNGASGGAVFVATLPRKHQSAQDERTPGSVRA